VDVKTTTPTIAPANRSAAESGRAAERAGVRAATVTASRCVVSK